MVEIEWMDAFAKNLRELMRERGMTQNELASASGMTQGMISSYLSKQKMPKIKSLVNLAYALNCSLDELADFGDTID